MRLPFLAAVMVVTCIIFPRVHAEEKLITLSSTIIGGTVEEESGTFPPGTASLCGTSGLSITAVLGIFGNNFPDADVPLFPETTQIFGGTWGGGDVRSGVVTLRGKTFQPAFFPLFFAELFLNFRSEAVAAIPPLGDVPAIVQAPFTFFGFVHRAERPSVAQWWWCRHAGSAAAPHRRRCLGLSRMAA